jgi:putative tryptophan/tyrosine transport system substrate-binding protein
MALMSLAGYGCTPGPIETGARRRLVYLGAAEARHDDGWHRYSNALKARDPGAWPHVDLRHVQVRVGTGDAAKADVAQALAGSPDVVVAPTGDSAAVALPIKRSAALIFSTFRDPVRSGLAQSLRHAGPGVTGVSLAEELHGKRLELLRDALPSVRSVAVLADSYTGTPAEIERALVFPGQALGLRMDLHLIDDPAAIDPLFSTLRPDAWYIPPTWIAWATEARILELLQRRAIPAMHATEAEVQRGGLISYAQDSSFVWDMLAELTLRVLAGEPAGSIPVQRPRRFVLSVRPRDEPAALRIAPAVVRRADRVY